MAEIDILALTEADRAHREQFMQYCITAAESRYQRVLRILYGHFGQWNAAFFGSKLFPPHFLILEPVSPTALGDYNRYSGWGSKSQIRIRPSLIDATHPHLVNGSRNPEGIERYWLDVALHECVHLYCHEILGRPEKAEKGHGLAFAAECTRIGALLGLPPVGPARQSRNKKKLPSCAFWPENVRPADYYLGAFRPDLAPSRAKPKQSGSAVPPVEDEEDGEGSPVPNNPLKPAEWQKLFTVVQGLPIAGLIERLAAYHGVAVAYPVAAPTAAPEPTEDATDATDAPTMPAPAAPANPAAPAVEALASSTTATAPEGVPPPLPAQPPFEDEHDGQILARLPAGFTPSHYQMNLFRFIVAGQGDGLVAAVAGSGKTTSLTMAARFTEGEGLFLAFNKHIAEELAGRLAGTGMVARTIHSVGYATLTQSIGKARIEENKYRKLAQEAIRSTNIPMGEAQRKATDALRQLVNLARLTLTDPRNGAALDTLIDHFGIEVESEARPHVLALLPDVLVIGDLLAREQRVIDFTDQLYLCHRWQLQPKQFNNLFVDECQDLNAAQLDLVLKSRVPGGRIVFVGDACQAIMGFAGADANSFWNIQARTGATLLPLSVCYRCPTSHLDLARTIVPEIEAAPGAAPGEIDTISEEQLAERVQRGDMIICRLTAPLVKTCIRLIERRMSARVKGRDIGEQLTAIVRAVTEQPLYRWEEFGRWLDIHESRQVAKLAQRNGSEGQIESLRDRVEAVRVCYQSFGVASVEALMTEIETLFNDDTPGVLLSTVHRAKGLENDRIFILYPEKLPLQWEGQQAWEKVQEENLRYVALTRAKQTLIFVSEKPTKKRLVLEEGI